MSAAGQQEALVEGRHHRPPEVHARLGAARALADAGDRIQADHDHRSAIALAQASGDDADHARVPALARDHQRRRRGMAGRFDGLHRLFLHLALDLLARGVQGVQLLGQGQGFGGVVGRQKTGAQVRPADTAAGVDPRTQDETRMEYRGRRRL